MEEIREMLLEHGRNTLPNVLFVSSECAPLAKTGGLADVVGALPKSLKKFGMDARVITPYHRVTKDRFGDKVEHLFHFYVDLGWRHQYCGIEKLVLDDVVIYLVDSEYYYGDKIYRGGAAEIEQYAFFQRAVLNAIPCLDFKPDIVHCNDWQAGIIPMLARTQYKGGMQEKLKYLLSIHNIAYQGRWNFQFVQDLLSIDSAYFTPEYIELDHDANFLKAGCVFADMLSTVSPNYANEIKTPYYGEGLQGILNARSSQLVGILNGIDTDVFNPETDKLIPSTYSQNNMDGKAVCKKALQEKLGLEVRDDVPIIGMVTRMTEQKGFELVMTVLDNLMSKEDVQFVLLGTGDHRYEDFMRHAEQLYKGRLCAYLGYNEELAHLVYAGSDFFLMPSRFEPCGLGQMNAMRYGTLPIVRETGGLKDSVIPFNIITGEGDGFSFANFDAWEMRNTIAYALKTYKDKNAMAELIRHAMEKDFSFEASAKEYMKLYVSMLDGYHETPPALVHDITDEKFRKPFGAVEQNTEVKMTLQILSGRVNFAKIHLYLNDMFFEYEMDVRKDKCTVSFNAPEKAGAWKYYFIIGTKYGTRYLCPDEYELNAKMTYNPEDGFSFTVYLKDFETPQWLGRSIMYQIFPDRFAFTSKKTATEGIKYHKSLGQSCYLHKSIDEEVKYTPSKGEKYYFPNDFYGGTFKGIERKLPYLKELGISCIYLNPIVESISNHRYDTSDYTRPDPILGSEDDFRSMCTKADKLGIRIILDGVYNHTGADSIYFNKFGHYNETGAYQSKDSKFYHWFKFKTHPDDYLSWWNFEDLPEVDENDTVWQDYIITGEDSILKTWLRKGASGWRLDVADELPDEILALMRKAVKSEKSDAPIIGEVWENAVTKCGQNGLRNYALGYSLDSVMNYPFRFAVLDFMHFRSDAYMFRSFLLMQKVMYPKPVYYSLMNLVSSHDVDRIRTALSTELTVKDLSREDQIKIAFDTEKIKNAVRREKIVSTIQFFLPGVPSIYYGDEQGMEGLCDPFNRRPFREDTENTGLYEHYSKLCALRNEKEILKSGDIDVIALNDDVFALIRFDSIKVQKPVLAIINRGDYDFKYHVDLKPYGSKKISGISKALSATILEG